MNRTSKFARSADWKSAIRQVRNLRYGALAVLLFCAASCLDLSAETFPVTTTNDTGDGSLRAAITSANGGSGTNTITFAIPPFDTTVKTITPASQQLPTIQRPVIIDGYTQTNSSANTKSNADDAVLLIELNGGIINGGQGLLIAETAAGTTIRGLVIDNNWSAGITVQASNVVVEGCFIGTDASGLVAHGNGQGIYTQFGLNIPASRFGGTSPAQRNVISGNATGILLQGGTNHVVQGNFLGTDATGTNALAQGTGLGLYTGGNFIGGTNAAARNVIAVTGTGVSVAGGAGGNRIQGNFIGTDVNGIKALGGGDGFGTGIAIGAGDTLIGGLTSVPGTPPGNVISGIHVTGIFVGENNTTVQGNLIGLDATGTKPLGNTLRGVELFGSFSVIGGTNVTARNVISANGHRGLQVGDGNGSVHDNLIQNNFIGTDITGTNLLGNGDDGIGFFKCFSNSIQSNVIAGNHSQGVEINASSGTTTSIAVLGNSIFDNAGLGISLSSGANNSQTNPVITSAATGGGNVTIQGFLNSTPNAQFRLEFFANSSCTANGFGQGEQFLGATNVTTAANGLNTFSVTLPGVTPVGPFFTATATDPNGNTSEFSARFPGGPCPPIIACALAPASITNAVGTFQSVTATVTSNGVPAASVNVTLRIISGPNAGVFGTATTDAGGQTSFSYLGSATPGTDTIEATGSVAGIAFACSATKVWVVPVSVSLPGGAVAWWRAESDANDSVDSHHGALQNGAGFASGKVGQAFRFDGVDDFVSVPDSAAWDFGLADFTIEFWVKLNQIKNSMFIHQQSGTGVGGFEFDLQLGALFFATDPQHAAIVRLWSPAPGTWYHLAVTRAQGAYRLYVNGRQLEDEQPDSNPVADVTGPLRIGSWADPGYEVDGLIDELTIYNRALTSAEVQAIVNADSAGKSLVFRMNWFTVDGGGGASTDGNFSVRGTFGQPDAGTLSGDAFTLRGGFWRTPFLVQPLLSITLSNGDVIVSWPITETNAVLQANSDLGTTNWMDVPVEPTTNGMRRNVRLPRGHGNQFFRPKK